MPPIRIIISYKHRPGAIKELRESLNGGGAALLSAAYSRTEHYVGVYLVEGDPTYSIELHTETQDPAVLEELNLLNSEQFTRGQTAMKIMWRFLDQTAPPRVRLMRPLHEAAPPRP
jgi:hypothetical protein